MILDHHDIIDDETLEAAREACTAIDQREALCIDAETWGVMYDGGQRGQMSRYPDGRGAICLGGDSMWGDWDEDRLQLDESDEHGNAVCYDAHGTESHRQTA